MIYPDMIIPFALKGLGYYVRLSYLTGVPWHKLWWMEWGYTTTVLTLFSLSQLAIFYSYLYPVHQPVLVRNHGSAQGVEGRIAWIGNRPSGLLFKYWKLANRVPGIGSWGGNAATVLFGIGFLKIVTSTQAQFSGIYLLPEPYVWVGFWGRFAILLGCLCAAASYLVDPTKPRGSTDPLDMATASRDVKGVVVYYRQPGRFFEQLWPNRLCKLALSAERLDYYPEEVHFDARSLIRERDGMALRYTIAGDHPFSQPEESDQYREEMDKQLHNIERTVGIAARAEPEANKEKLRKSTGYMAFE